MIQLTQEQFNVLTYIHHFEAQHTHACRHSDIQAGCGLEDGTKTRAVLACLECKGLVELYRVPLNGTSVRCARSNVKAAGLVGIEFKDAEGVRL